jgi:electron transport complex protein RnfG
MSKFIEESWLVLTMGIAFAALLAGTQAAVTERIADNQSAELSAAILEVVPAMDPASTPEKLEIAGKEAYRCQAEDGSLAGWAIVNAGGGFIDKIRLVTGLSPDGSEIIGIKVIEHLETPGLGNKIETKGDENPYPLQYAGKSTGGPLELVKGTAGQPSQIEAITGATYSSQYVMDIVNEITARVLPELPKE